MFYETARRDHGLRYDPFKAIVAPRPIGWVSTLSPEGIANLAPYSFFNAISSRPDLVMFSSEGEKDTLTNVRASGEFVLNHVSMKFAQSMNETSVAAPRGVSEFDHVGIAKHPSVLVKPPRVAGVLAALECKVVRLIELTGLNNVPNGSTLVIGEVIGVFIDDGALKDGFFHPEDARPVARMGYSDYAGPDGYFRMGRPKWPDPR